MKPRYDIVFAGGGLANGLAALTLRERRPELSILIAEAGPTLGGSHTWSFHESDLTAAQNRRLEPLVSGRWSGYDVLFPAFRRSFSGGYRSIRSGDFHRVVSTLEGVDVSLNSPARELSAGSAVLHGRRIEGCVIDGRGWSGPASPNLGYQKFLGLDVKLDRPHGLERPLLMDATVEQTDGFRFFYLLPWSGDRLLIEDTHYSDTPDIDAARYRDEIRRYAARRGWTIAAIEREETGSLAIPLEGESPAVQTDVALSGARAGLFHATTGYSLPAAMRFGEALAGRADFQPDKTAAWARDHARRHWEKESFFRMLNRLLFRAAAPERRYKVLERFYRRPQPLVERFYAGRLTPFDGLRLLTGVPPVPLTRALACWRARPVLGRAA